MAAGSVGEADPARLAYLVWTVIHGTVSIELTHALRSPLRFETPDEGEQLLHEGVRSLLASLR